MSNQGQNNANNTLGGRLPESIEVNFVYDSVESYISAMCILFTHDPTIKFDFNTVPSTTQNLSTSTTLIDNYCNRILLADVIYSYPDHKERDVVWRGAYYDNATWAIQREIYPDIHASEHTSMKKSYNDGIPKISVPYFLMTTIDYKEYNPIYLEIPALVRMINLYYQEYCVDNGVMPAIYRDTYELFKKLTQHYPPHMQEIIDLLKINDIVDLKAAIERMMQYE